MRPITTKTYIVINLKHDLQSGKALNKAGIDSSLIRILRNQEYSSNPLFVLNEFFEFVGVKL